jgi:hypothetical protein
MAPAFRRHPSFTAVEVVLGDLPEYVAVRPLDAHFEVACSRCSAVHLVYFATVRKDVAAIERIVGSHALCATKTSST